MRDCFITINNDGTVELSAVSQYVGEHAATRLVITLNDELAEEGVSYYTLGFNMTANSLNPFNVKFCSDMITAETENGYIENGTIYFVLPKALTLCTGLTVQVQAHTADSEGAVTKTVKSPTFTVAFEKSVEGDEELIPDRTVELIEEMRQTLKKMNMSIEEISLNSASRHVHSNPKTLASLYREDLENSITVGATTANYLMCAGTPLRYATDGAVISGMQEAEHNGAKYLRLFLESGPLGLKNVRDFIDIPVTAVNTVSDGGVNLNGTRLDFGKGETDSEIDRIWETIEQIQGETDEIEAMIDESGVLE